MFRVTTATILILGLSALSARAADGESAPTSILIRPAASAPARPAALPLLYVSLAALQTYDVYSTRTALGHGASEANPVMQGVVGNTPALVALKAASAASAILLAERLWKTNRTAAIVTMVLANGVVAAVAMNNARVINRGR